MYKHKGKLQKRAVRTDFESAKQSRRCEVFPVVNRRAAVTKKN